MGVYAAYKAWIEPNLGTFMTVARDGTEAGKAYVAQFERSGRTADAVRAHDFMRVVFQHYFVGRRAWRNRVDAQGQTLQPYALSRLLYHVAMFVTEGERVGLWADQPTG